MQILRDRVPPKHINVTIQDNIPQICVANIKQERIFINLSGALIKTD